MTTRLTITEALAELKTIDKRLQTNWEFIAPRLARPVQLKDPLESEGGITAVIAQKRQSSADLRARILKIRVAIAKVNQVTPLTIEGFTYSLAEWIVWKREVAPKVKVELTEIAKAMDSLRAQVRQRGGNLKNSEQGAEPQDVVLHVSETDIAALRDQHEKILGILDGQLSLKNATTFIELTD